MNYQTQRNNTIRKYITGIYHLNWIKLDGNSNIEHDKKVCEICLKLREKGLDFLTRPLVEWIVGSKETFKKCFRCGKKAEYYNSTSGNYACEECSFDRSWWSKLKPIPITEQLIPDILTFIKSPFKPVVIEVTNSEKKEHVESKNYPKDFKVIPFGVKDSVEELVL